MNTNFYKKSGRFMKKLIAIIICAGMFFSMAACSSKDNSDTTSSFETLILDKGRNARSIAKALLVEEDNRRVSILVDCLENIGAGNIHVNSVTFVNKDEYELIIKGEDGTLFKVHLANDLSLLGIQNTNSGEWVVKSAK